MTVFAKSVIFRGDVHRFLSEFEISGNATLLADVSECFPLMFESIKKI